MIVSHRAFSLIVLGLSIDLLKAHTDMSADCISPDQDIEESWGNKRRARAFVWEYFEKIIGEDGLPKTKCTKCNTVYNLAPTSGTSTLRRHLRKCCRQPISQATPLQVIPGTKTPSSSDKLSDEARSAKKLKCKSRDEVSDEASANKLKSAMVDNLHGKTDRELVEFIWKYKRNVGLLEQKLPHKAMAIKEAIKCYEDEIARRAKPHRPKENGPDLVSSAAPVKIEWDDQIVDRSEKVGEDVAENGSAVANETPDTHADANQDQMPPPCENGEVVIKVEVDDQSAAGNENFEDQIQKPTQQTEISILPEDICSELKEVSSVLSVLTSPNSFYTPQGNPLDQEAENAKQNLTKLLKKDFETIIGSPDEQNVKSCISILIKNLHKLPRFQGKVIETLNTEFESACKNWTTWHKIVETNIVLEAQQENNLEVLQVWQEKDVEFESKIAKVDADILELKAQLREKELIREGLIKQKCDLFDQSKISIDEAKKLLHEMVTVKLQSDVATDNMKELSSKWERIRENFKFE
ncbi:uncharacterized protein [Rutidosis leptorrhynchoides]|uniref:uncharacterized protein isoform X2 n=1 Tax=Rutidosis leptorrhynchoides TaxID=125765 RepID=UPI003A9A500F